MDNCLFVLFFRVRALVKFAECCPQLQDYKAQYPVQGGKYEVQKIKKNCFPQAVSLGDLEGVGTIKPPLLELFTSRSPPLLGLT